MPRHQLTQEDRRRGGSRPASDKSKEVARAKAIKTKPSKHSTGAKTALGKVKSAKNVEARQPVWRLVMDKDAFAKFKKSDRKLFIKTIEVVLDDAGLPYEKVRLVLTSNVAFIGYEVHRSYIVEVFVTGKQWPWGRYDGVVDPLCQWWMSEKVKT
jgi:hypothetical protein